MTKRDTQSSDEFQVEYHKKKMSYKSKVLHSNMQYLYSRRKLAMNFRIILQKMEIFRQAETSQLTFKNCGQFKKKRKEKKNKEKYFQ
jgi:hypothetical protein